MASLAELRTRHPRLVYQNASVMLDQNDILISCEYVLEPNISLRTVIRFKNIGQDRWQTLNQDVIKHWAFQIGLVELLSYWKAACPAKIVIKAGYLWPEQLPFWQTLLQKGLSEFFFVNQIDGWQKDFVRWEIDHPEDTYPIDQQVHKDRVMVPMGGGKDSVVTWEILKKLGQRIHTVVINPTGQVTQLLKVADAAENVTITRELDPQLAELNKAGYLNGHTPFSAMAAFVLTLAAYLHDDHYVAVSNEISANEGNTTFLGQSINHQYSKSLEFETAFRDYCHKYLSSSIEYFSFLRPLHEIQIAQIFATLPDYFPVFLSCNRGRAEGKWCGKCPKCMFVYVMLSPFLKTAQLERIFGQNLLAKTELQSILDELTGMVECKSLECVGTRQESITALALTLQRWPSDQPLPALLTYAKEKILPTEPGLLKAAPKLLTSLHPTHFVPSLFWEVLQHSLQASAV